MLLPGVWKAWSTFDSEQAGRDLSPTNSTQYSVLSGSSGYKPTRDYLVASLFTALKNIQNSVCLDCKPTVGKLVPSSPVLGPAGPSHIPFWRQVFKGRGSGSLQLPTSDSTRPASPDPNQITRRREDHVWTVVINAKELGPSLKAKFERGVAFPLAGSVVNVRFSSDG